MTVSLRLRMLVSIFVVLATAGCQERELRGTVDASADGRTYLVVMDDNGGFCGPILVDGNAWPHPIGARGVIEPGSHTIECGGKIAFEIAAGTTFGFDYWGP